MSKNDITGDVIKSKVGNTAAFDSGYELIWGKKTKPKPTPLWSDEDELRVDIIGSNGPTGDHYGVD